MGRSAPGRDLDAPPAIAAPVEPMPVSAKVPPVPGATAAFDIPLHSIVELADLTAQAPRKSPGRPPAPMISSGDPLAAIAQLAEVTADASPKVAARPHSPTILARLTLWVGSHALVAIVGFFVLREAGVFKVKTKNDSSVAPERRSVEREIQKVVTVQPARKHSVGGDKPSSTASGPAQKPLHRDAAATVAASVAESSQTRPAVAETSDSTKELRAHEGVPIASVPQISIPELPVEAGKVDVDAATEFAETGSGLKYRILRRSDAQKPGEFSVVDVHYHGWLDDGTVFDSSYRDNKPLSAPLNKVIPGWAEGLQLIGIGGMIELEIPPSLGYGKRGAARIPAQSTLHFLVELIDIKR